jgi:hypothetical protein
MAKRSNETELPALFPCVYSMLSPNNDYDNRAFNRVIPWASGVHLAHFPCRGFLGPNGKNRSHIGGIQHECFSEHP